jgi:extracellular factor (EF) 3-hydroxypalmitic acid methyl ester biosynthesis protein
MAASRSTVGERADAEPSLRVTLEVNGEALPATVAVASRLSLREAGCQIFLRVEKPA